MRALNLASRLRSSSQIVSKDHIQIVSKDQIQIVSKDQNVLLTEAFEEATMSAFEMQLKKDLNVGGGTSDAQNPPEPTSHTVKDYEDVQVTLLEGHMLNWLNKKGFTPEFFTDPDKFPKLLRYFCARTRVPSPDDPKKESTCFHIDDLNDGGKDSSSHCVCRILMPWSCWREFLSKIAQQFSNAAEPIRRFIVISVCALVRFIFKLFRNFLRKTSIIHALMYFGTASFRTFDKSVNFGEDPNMLIACFVKFMVEMLRINLHLPEPAKGTIMSIMVLSAPTLVATVSQTIKDNKIPIIAQAEGAIASTEQSLLQLLEERPLKRS